MPTDENLRHRSCTYTYVCFLCKLNTENSNHLFLIYLFSNHIWLWLVNKFNCTFDLSFPGSDCIPLRCSSQVKNIYIVSIIHAMQIIWTTKNILRFGTNNVSIYITKTIIGSEIAMSGNISNGNCLPSDSVLLDSLLVSPKHMCFKDIATCLVEIGHLSLD